VADNKKMHLNPKAYREVARALHASAETFLQTNNLKPNVKGLGAGVKWVNGQPTGEPAVIVFVSKKIGKEHLSNADMIPKKLAGMQTDVVAIGDVRAQAEFPSRVRPLVGGASISTLNGGTGTLAICVTDQIDLDLQASVAPNHYILSNNHVLANNNKGIEGDPIIQPGSIDGGRQSELRAFLDIYPFNLNHQYRANNIRTMWMQL